MNYDDKNVHHHSLCVTLFLVTIIEKNFGKPNIYSIRSLIDVTFDFLHFPRYNFYRQYLYFHKCKHYKKCIFESCISRRIQQDSTWLYYFSFYIKNYWSWSKGGEWIIPKVNVLHLKQNAGSIKKQFENQAKWCLIQEWCLTYHNSSVMCIVLSRSITII